MSDFDLSDDERRRLLLAGEMNDADEELERAISRMQKREASDPAIAFVLLERALKIGFGALGPHFSMVIHDAVERLGSTEMRN